MEHRETPPQPAAGPQRSRSWRTEQPRYRRALAVAAAAALAAASMSATAAAAVPAEQHDPEIVHVGQIDRQDIAPQPGSEPDTLVEPHVAVSPLDPRIAVVAAHDGRFSDGGAVDISYGWTHDGGRTWHHAPLPKLTRASGGIWDRASDPVVAFGPDGTVYVSTLLVSLQCPSGVAVSRSTDGGRTFGPPVEAHFSADCAYSDDKNWLVVDTSRHSRHRGRLYQFWTPFRSDAAGNFLASPQVLRWSDDRGEHWSPTVTVSDPGASSQNSQPMIQPDGTVVDTYENFGAGRPGDQPEHHRPHAGAAPRSAAPAAGTRLVARTSHDGGATWSPEVTVTTDVGNGPADVRCCLPAATADPVSGRLYAAWNSVDPAAVFLSRSGDGTHWSAPIRVNPADGPTLASVNVAVAAYDEHVFVSYGRRDTAVRGGRFVQQRVSASEDNGRHFDAPVPLGPPSDLRFAAQSGGFFPGDYVGAAATTDRAYLVWCRSSTPPDPAALFHQTMYAAVLRP